MRSFLEAYRPERLIIVTTGVTAEARIGETQIRWTPAPALRAAIGG
jgi:hypothetical protein